MNNNPETKLCRHCRSEMDVKATVCPNCHKSQRRGKGCIIALIIAVIFIGIPLIFMVSCSKALSDTIDEENKKADAKSISANEVIFDEKGLKITYKGTEADDLNVGTDIKLAFENNSDRSYDVTIDDFSIDGYSINAMFYVQVASGKSSNSSIEVLDSYLKDNGLSADSIKQVTMKIVITDFDSFDTYESDVTFDLR
ncbi:MAG TPA: hypothetical protein RWO66_00795 [Ruminococcus sp.]